MAMLSAEHLEIHLQRYRLLFELTAIVISACILTYSLFVNGGTYDERVHINHGIVFWRTAQPDFDPMHPPLVSILAFPIGLFYDIPLPQEPEDALPSGKLGKRVLTRCRSIALIVFLSFAWVFGRIAARWMGVLPGYIALLLMLFEPTFGSHAYLVTTDPLFTYTSFLLLAASYEWVLKPTWIRTCTLGAALGLVLLAKFTAPLWIAGVAAGLAVFVAANALCCRTQWLWQKEEQRRILGLRMVQVLTATMFALFLLAMVYRFEGIGTPLRSLELGEHGLGPATRLIEWFPSPVPRKYLRAFDWALQHTSRPAYFHGEFSQRGNFLLYFPLLLLMKPPLWLHALVLMATIGFLFQKSRNWPTVLFFGSPIALLVAYASTHGIQIGVRHIFPVFPVLLLAAAWATSVLQPMIWRISTILLVILCVGTGIVLTPHQLAYFNSLAGGTADAWMWYSDSNQDWGQGQWHIERFQRREKITLHFDPIEGVTTGLIAVSTNQLVGVSPKLHDSRRWLREGFRRERFVLPYWHIYRIPDDYWRRKSAEPVHAHD